MKIKKVTRTRCECDHCGKVGYSKHHMGNHELHCTMNPARDCRVCALIGDHHTHTMAELMACLPSEQETIDYAVEANRGGGYVHGKDSEIINKGVAVLRKMAEQCPACMMAALRQKGLCVPMATDFDYKEEMQLIFREYEQRQAEDAEHGMY